VAAKDDDFPHGNTPNYEERNDGRLDLTLDRVIDVPRTFVWKVWTDPQHLMKWWAPRPWSTVECSMDLRPGGAMRTVMRSPEGQDFPYVGCFLEVVPQEKIILTNALEPGYRPALEPFFTVILTFKDLGAKTGYHALVLHRDEEGKKKHEAMGFHQGWGQALDQLVGVAKELQR
jgi:uncharacterized protein YndB with AHSA1/START domain